jgi:hypothetical protein
MSLSAEFDSRTDRFAYAVVSLGAAALSYDHARTFFLPFMGRVGASVTPLMLDAVLFWLATAGIRQARKGRPLPMLRIGAYVLLALSVAANALGGATWPERLFMALPAALFGFLTEVQIRLALYEHRATRGESDRLALLLWLRHPVRSTRAKLWQARQHAPAFDTASAERDRLAAARDAVRLAMPGRARDIRRARAGVLRELNAGRLAPAAVAASGLMGKPGVPELHRVALAAAFGSTLAIAREPGEAGALRTELESVRETARTELASVRTELRKEIAAVRTSVRQPAPDPPDTEPPAVDRDALVTELADQIRDAISSGDRWTPDYDALMKRTGYRRSWCEKAVRDARTQAFSAPQETRTDIPRLRRVRTDDTDNQPPEAA